MIENYEVFPCGVIKQITKKSFNYGYEYSNKYNQLGELGIQMSYLRLGYIIGSIGHIPNNILDVGYGNGDFLKISSNVISNCYGSDVTRDYPIPDNCTFVNDIYETDYEVVCFFDVLEHFENIYDIKKLKAKYIIDSLPNCHNFSDDWFYNWKHRKPNEHLWHFNEKSLILFMKEIGYDLINTCSIEDVIRKHGHDYSNILTGIFKKNG